MPAFPKYSPVRPAPAARRKAALAQAWRLPRTLATLYKVIQQDLCLAALDEHLWSFWAFHNGEADPHCQARRWRKVQLAAIGPRNVAGLPVAEMAFMMNVAMEIEEPILEYSRENGEGFRFLLPALGRFMGKNREEAAYAAERGMPWCESPWCEEERRHANTFARMIERLTNTSPGRGNPNRPMAATPDEEGAVKLVISREAAEWSSSSTYFVMAAHATGDLHNLIRNVACDEVKHLSILSAADRYLFGPRPWNRFTDLVRKSLDEYRGHRRKRSGGDLLGTNPITAFEVVVCHMLIERRIRNWLESLPLFTLEAVFETCSSLYESTLFDETFAKGNEKRTSLARWKPESREIAAGQRRFEAGRSGAIEETVATELHGFRGAEVPGSPGERKVLGKIRTFGAKMFRTCLTNRLRDYQIRNNLYVTARQSREMVEGASRR